MHVNTFEINNLTFDNIITTRLIAIKKSTCERKVHARRPHEKIVSLHMSHFYIDVDTKCIFVLREWDQLHTTYQYKKHSKL